MSNRQVATDSEILEVYGKLQSQRATVNHFQEIGIGLSRKRVKRLISTPQAPQIEPPQISDPSEPIESIIQRQLVRCQRKRKQSQEKKWMPFRVSTDRPIAITFFGDPHLDNKHCNWDAMLGTIDTIKDHPQMFGVNMGDLTDNWVGRLVAEYGESSVTRSEAWRLVEWFIHSSGVKWLVHLLGNHDSWNDGAEIFKRINNGVYHFDDWRARFKLVFPSGAEVKIDAAHDHKGHSQFNPLHGQKKVTIMEEPADIVIGAHKHTWGIACEENPHTGFVTWLARARGYKESESGYDYRGQWGNQQLGHAITAVIDPCQPQNRRVQMFNDAKAARAYLDTIK